MNADQENFKHKELTDLIIKAFYVVYNQLGYGFLEKVYVNALHLELGKFGLKTITQSPISVFYDGKTIGEYFCRHPGQ